MALLYLLHQNQTLFLNSQLYHYFVPAHLHQIYFLEVIRQRYLLSYWLSIGIILSSWNLHTVSQTAGESLPSAKMEHYIR